MRADKNSKFTWCKADWDQLRRNLGTVSELPDDRNAAVQDALKIAAELHTRDCTVVVFCNPALLQDTLTRLTNKHYAHSWQPTLYDTDASVKRVANGLWKTAGGAPKVQKAIMPSVSKTLQKFRGGSKGPGAQKLALEVLDQLVKAGELEAIEEAVPEVPKFQFPPSAERAFEPRKPAVSLLEPLVSLCRGTQIYRCTPCGSQFALWLVAGFAWDLGAFWGPGQEADTSWVT
eukprot:s2385_g9.t1